MVSKTKNQSFAIRALQIAFGFLILSCIGLGIYLFFINPKTAGAEAEPDESLVFVEGVSVEGISLFGLTKDEAKAKLGVVEMEILNGIQLVAETETVSVTFTHADFEISFNTDAVLEEAFTLGNTGTRKEKSDEREALLIEPREFSIQYEINAAPAQSKIAELSSAIFREPVNASAHMDMTVEGWFVYEEGIDGQQLDEAKFSADLIDGAKTGEFTTLTLPIVYEQPELSVADLQSSIVKRSKAETSFAKSPYNREDRVYNVKKAAAFVNGYVLKPEEVFSTNDTLGPRTYELGWKPAPAYVNGGTEDQAGGGVCQVSSTLYNAVVKGDLEIVSRKNHSSPVGYVSRGLDATINTGTIDFQFKNNTGSDIYIFAYTIDSKDQKVPDGMTDKTIHIEIWGAELPPEYDEIKLTAEKTETIKPSGEMEVVVDTTVAWDYRNEEVERREGAVYQSYKHYYKDGVEVKSEKLAKSTYRAYAGKIVVGQGYLYGEQPIVEGTN